MRNTLIPAALTGVMALALVGPPLGGAAFADTLSNRHHLSDCTVQSAPVVIPYADVRTVRLGLPADLDGRTRIEEVYGYEEETRLRLRRRGLSVQTHGGGAVLTLPERGGC